MTETDSAGGRRRAPDLEDQSDRQDPDQRYGYVTAGDKGALVKRMRRIEGQARGIERMITDDRYCIDILTQIAAVSTALEAVAGILLDDHVNHCVRHAISSGDEAAAVEKTAELLKAVHHFTRTR